MQNLFLFQFTVRMKVDVIVVTYSTSPLRVCHASNIHANTQRVHKTTVKLPKSPFLLRKIHDDQEFISSG